MTNKGACRSLDSMEIDIEDLVTLALTMAAWYDPMSRAEFARTLIEELEYKFRRAEVPLDFSHWKARCGGGTLRYFRAVGKIPHVDDDSEDELLISFQLQDPAFTAAEEDGAFQLVTPEPAAAETALNGSSDPGYARIYDQDGVCLIQFEDLAGMLPQLVHGLKYAVKNFPTLRIG